MKLIKLIFALTLMLMIYASPASAEYSFQVVSPPGAEFTQTFGVDEGRTVVGTAIDGVTTYSFTYDMVSGEYTTISDVISVLEISNSGVMVGNVDDVCAIRDKKGNITTFFPPSWTDDSRCVARGVNAKGQISGYQIDEFNVWLGFVYDSKKDTYEEFLPSQQTVANAINASGQIAGSEWLDTDDAYTGSPAGRYGFIRQKNGSVKYFEISQSFPGFTRARGISDIGQIAGWYGDPATFQFKSYVTTLSDGPEFETITLTDDQMLYQKPCDPNIPAAPGPGYVLFTDIFAEQIRTDGVVVGNCSDYYFNFGTGVFIDYNYGFIATPID